MTQSPTDLTSLVGSRICHDLISPLGAIANGIELLSMSGVATSPELALISDSVQSANARIKYFRVAYGAAKSNQQMGRGEIVKILADMSKGGRISYSWEPNGDSSRSDVRIAFLLMQCLESAMPYGGTIKVASLHGKWTLTAVSDKFKFDDALWDSLEDVNGPHDHIAADVHFALTPHILLAHGKTLERDLTDEALTLRF
ncbi:MAG: histidine phosphotransferase family protein [Pseudomonadota bacterium]